jgi:hypothetical protein
MIAGRTYEGNPNTLEEAITRARAIETGNNFLIQSLSQNSPIVEMSNNKPELSNKPKDDIEELTKQLENLKIAKLEKEIKSLKGEVYGTNKRPIQANKPQFDFRKAKCYSCGKIGHTSRFCREPSNSKRMNTYDYEEYGEEEQEYYYQEYESDEEDY